MEDDDEEKDEGSLMQQTVNAGLRWQHGNCEKTLKDEWRR